MPDNKVFDAYAAYYDLLYQDKDYAGEVAYIANLLSRYVKDPKMVLELGCGTGNHALELVRSGYHVTGVDLSDEMICCARERASTISPQQLNFIQSDLRSFRTEQLFDAVLALFHVMSYQTSNADLKAAIATAAEHLKPGGVFVFDCWYGPGVLTNPPVTRIKRMQGNDCQITRLAEPQHYPSENRVDVHYEIIVEGPSGVQKINECRL